MKKTIWYTFILIGALSVSGCSSSSAAIPTQNQSEVTQEALEIKELYEGISLPKDVISVTMDTSMGTLKMKLFPSEAPKAVENFITHAKAGYYDGVIFHRVIDEFMVQTGDPTGTGRGGESIWGEGFETEVSGQLFHFYGALSMANTGQPNSNGSQFFIVNASSVDNGLISQLEAANFPQESIDLYKEVGGTPHLDGAHPVFGYVTEGMDVVNAIAKVEKDKADKPMTDVVIQSIVIEEAIAE